MPAGLAHTNLSLELAKQNERIISCASFRVGVKNNRPTESFISTRKFWVRDSDSSLT